MNPYLMQRLAEERINDMLSEAATRRQVREARRARRAQRAQRAGQARRSHESLPVRPMAQGRVAPEAAGRTREPADHAAADHRGLADRRAA